MRPLFFSILFIFTAVLSFAADSLRTHISIEGTAQNREQEKYFLDNFRLEATSLGFTPEINKANAGYNFKFNVIPNTITYDDGTVEQAPPDEPQFVLQITFTKNSDGTELISFDHQFSELEEMYEYNQYLFFQAVVVIPADSEAAKADDSWRNKWLYLRLSADLPITFYLLQPKGLLHDTAVYTGEDIDNPTWFSPIDNRTVALPGVTLGLEVQFLDWKYVGISAEPKLQVGWEHLNNVDFISTTAGLDIRVPLKFMDNVALAPYLSVSYPFSIPIPLDVFDPSRIFDSFPLLGVGGGLQLGVKGGKLGAAFFDVSYMYFIGDVGIKNHFNFPSITSKPDVIYFQRQVIGLSIGYKFGFINRNKAPQ